MGLSYRATAGHFYCTPEAIYISSPLAMQQHHVASIALYKHVLYLSAFRDVGVTMTSADT